MLIRLVLLLGALLLMAAGYVAFLVLRFMVRIFLGDPSVTFEFSEQDAQPMPAGLTAERHEFQAADGARLVGTLIRGGGEPKGLVVFAPEFGGTQDTWRRYAAFLPENGWWLFTFDFRSSGHSAPFPGHMSRKWLSDREVLDLEAAIAHARTLDGGRFPRVSLFGISRGGLASLVVASKDRDVQGVVIEGSGSTLEVIRQYTRKWSLVYAPERLCRAIPEPIYDLAAWLVLRIGEWQSGLKFALIEEVRGPASGLPTLFIHGERDRHVVPDVARAVVKAYPGPKELWMVPGARHNGAVLKAPDEYRDRVLGHFERVAGKSAVTSPARATVNPPGVSVATAD